MSRRSQRLSTIRYCQSNGGDDSGSSNGESLLLGGQKDVYRDSPNSRSLRRKSSSTKRSSPAPSLKSSPAAQTTYYSESVISESYLNDGKEFSAQTSAALDEPLSRKSYWNEDLPVRRRRGTGSTESSKTNGLTEKQTYDIYASSGYSSEDDYKGHIWLNQNGSGSTFSNVLSNAGSLLWFVLTSPGRFFGLLYWWIGTTWYRLMTAASLLDVFVLTRSYSVLKKLLLLLLLLLLLTAFGYGAWYFYPFGLHPSMFSWGTAMSPIPITKMVHETRDFTAFYEAQQRVLSRLQALEKRFDTLEDAAAMLKLQKGAASTEAALPQDEVLVLLDEMVKRRETAMKVDFHTEMDSHLQRELDASHARVQKDFDSLLERVFKAFKDTEDRMVQMNSQWQSSTQEGLTGAFQKEVGTLEAQLADLKKTIVTLASDQKVLAEQVESLPGQIRKAQEDVEIQFSSWLSRFLAQSKQDGTGSIFLHHEELQEELQKLEDKILAKRVAGVTLEKVHDVVDRALKRYNADRVGMADYALESAGASVVNTRCSESYDAHTSVLTLFGVPVWWFSTSPRDILQPQVYPGNCWAIKGSEGFIVIRLSRNIHPTAVTLEHIPKSISPEGTILSAPKDFSVFGLNEEEQQEGIHLGTFTFDQDGDPIQTFHFQLQDEEKNAAFQLVELRVLSNWGNPKYTCIYRFRVHGELVS